MEDSDAEDGQNNDDNVQGNAIVPNATKKRRWAHAGYNFWSLIISSLTSY